MKMRALAVLVAVVAASSFAVPAASAAQPAQGSAGPTVMAVDGFCEWAKVKPFCW